MGEKTESSEHSQVVESEKAASPETGQVLNKSLADLAVESWRFSKVFAKVLQKLDASEAGRYKGKTILVSGKT